MRSYKGAVSVVLCKAPRIPVIMISGNQVLRVIGGTDGGGEGNASSSVAKRRIVRMGGQFGPNELAG